MKVLKLAALLVLGLGLGTLGLCQGQIPPVHTLGFSVVFAVAWSSDGRYLAAGSARGALDRHG